MAKPKPKGDRLQCRAYGPSTHLAFNVYVESGEDPARKILERLDAHCHDSEQVPLYELRADRPNVQVLFVRRSDAVRCGFPRFVHVHEHGTF